MSRTMTDVQDAGRARELVRALAVVQREQLKLGAYPPRPGAVEALADYQLRVQGHLGRPLTADEVDAAVVLWRNGRTVLAITTLFELAAEVS